MDCNNLAFDSKRIREKKDTLQILGTNWLFHQQEWVLFTSDVFYVTQKDILLLHWEFQDDQMDPRSKIGF